MLRVYIPGDAAVYRNYARAVRRAGAVPCFTDDPADCGCLLLPGGGDLSPMLYGQTDIACRGLDPARDTMEMDLLNLFTSAHRPVLGVCRGMQSVNVFFGGTLVQDLPGHSSVHGSDRLHSVTAAPSLLRRLYGERCVVNSSHHQSVDRFGAGLEALQWAPDGTVEALRHRTLPILCVQWHPERLSLPGAADGQLLYDTFLSMAKL